MNLNFWPKMYGGGGSGGSATVGFLGVGGGSAGKVAAASAMVTAINEAAQFPDEEVRLVIHCGILGADAKSTYENRMNKFWSKKNEILNSFQTNVLNKNIKDYF